MSECYSAISLLFLLFIFFLPITCAADGFGWTYYAFDYSKLNYVFGGEFYKTNQGRKYIEKYAQLPHYEEDVSTPLLNMLKSGWKNQYSKDKNALQWDIVHTTLSENLLPIFKPKLLNNADLLLPDSINLAKKYLPKTEPKILEYFSFGREIGETDGYTNCPWLSKGNESLGKYFDCSPSYFLLSPTEVNIFSTQLKTILLNKNFQKESRFGRNDSSYSDIETLYINTLYAKSKGFGLFFYGSN